MYHYSFTKIVKVWRASLGGNFKTKKAEQEREKAIKITSYKVYFICCSDTISAISLPLSLSFNMKVERNVTEGEKSRRNQR